MSAMSATGNHGALASRQDIGGSHDAIGKRVPASVDVVEVELGDANAGVEGREEGLAQVCHVQQSVARMMPSGIECLHP